MKFWEEKWITTEVTGPPGVGNWGVLRYVDGETGAMVAFNDPERIRLAACAPEAIRLLLEKEWSGGGPVYQCPWCEATTDPHAFDCKLVALLKKAGVR